MLLNRFVSSLRPPFIIAAVALIGSPSFAGPQEKQVPQAPVTPQTGPKDKRTHAEGQAAMRKLDKAVAPYVARAKKTWPEVKARFERGLPKGQRLYVTCRLQENKGKQQEIVFIAVEVIDKRKVIGKIANTLASVRTYKTGQRLSLLEDDLLDWTITRPDGTEEGNVVGKFLDAYKP